MNWLGSNWIWIALVFGMFAMHFFGHRGHGHGLAGGHGHNHGSGDDRDRSSRSMDRTVSRDGDPPAHAHAGPADESGAAPAGSIVPRVAGGEDGASVNPAPSPGDAHAGHGDVRPPEGKRHRHGC
jgi:hypothetical protein